ncbi:MAG: DUF1015 domain-containing protein [Candidatus Omnitrophota bacterium]
MTQIKAFKATCYNKEKIHDLSQVVCPPYDVISPAEQTQYHNAHPMNFIRVLLGQEKAKDDRYDNKYTRARKIFEEWIKKGILKEDAKPCLYFYKQEYMIRGEKYRRIGFIGLMRLQDKEESRILPHENTHAKAKEDRLRLWRNTKAQLSPIFVGFSDRERKVENVFHEHVAMTEPFMDLVDVEGIHHTLWRLEDARLINQIKDALMDKHFFIADGHHRYEVAMELRRSLLGKKTRVNDQEPCNFILTYFTNLDSRDLAILPIHRVIKRLRNKLDFLEDYFRIDKIKNKEDLKILLAKAGQNERAIGFYSKDGIKLLRLKNRLLIDEHIKEGSSDFRQLDATILRCFILDPLRISSDDIIYVKDVNEAIGLVDAQKADACFIMNPVKVAELKAIALNGERMPPKTTYFYPKVLSGLTIYRLNTK